MVASEGMDSLSSPLVRRRVSGSSGEPVARMGPTTAMEAKVMPSIETTETRTESLRQAAVILEGAFTAVAALPGLTDQERAGWTRRARLARRLPETQLHRIH